MFQFSFLSIMTSHILELTSYESQLAIDAPTTVIAFRQMRIASFNLEEYLQSKHAKTGKRKGSHLLTRLVASLVEVVPIW